jgi:hypothetical protein
MGTAYAGFGLCRFGESRMIAKQTLASYTIPRRERNQNALFDARCCPKELLRFPEPYI